MRRIGVIVGILILILLVFTAYWLYWRPARQVAVTLSAPTEQKAEAIAETPSKAAPKPQVQALVQPPPAPLSVAEVKRPKTQPVLPTLPIGPDKFQYGPEWKVRREPTGWNGKGPRVEWAWNRGNRTRIKRILDPEKCVVIERLQDGAGYTHERIRDNGKDVTIERISRPGQVIENIRDEVKGGTVNRLEEGGYLTTIIQDANGLRAPLKVPISQVPSDNRARPPCYFP